MIDRRAADIKAEFPEMRGFSRRNLNYMCAFAEAWPDPAIVQRLIARLPWGQNIDLLDKLKDPDARLWYAQAAVENGWSRNVLALQIDTRVHERQGRAVTNFERMLPTPQSDLAGQLLKDPYQFDFLALADDAREHELEVALTERVQNLLLEMSLTSFMEARKASTSASMACSSSRRAPVRRMAVNGSSISSG